MESYNDAGGMFPRAVPNSPMTTAPNTATRIRAIEELLIFIVD